jgi:hypothetical protein
MARTEQRVSYRLRGQVRHGTIIGWEAYPGTREVYLVKNDASGVIHRVLPQWIIAS